MKPRIINEIEDLRGELIDLSHGIFNSPETNFKEYESSKRIVSLLKEHNITTTYPYCGLDTAFRAEVVGKSSQGPNIAIMAEYDALPGVGHGCGHNIIASAAVGAFLGLVPLMEHVHGRLTLLGTPAEEGGGGKIFLLDGGAFDDIDFSMMIHPSAGHSYLGRPARAACHYYVNYHGQTAHSSEPQSGINALSAARALFALVDIIRPAFPGSYNANGVIKQAGEAGNVIPDFAEIEFSLRAETLEGLGDLISRVERCALSASEVVGTTIDLHCSPLYAERYSNIVMDRLFEENMIALGETPVWPEPGRMWGSSDAGNVSIEVPTIHEYIAIAPEGTPSHSTIMADYSISERGDEACIKGAQALAMTAWDLFEDPSVQESAQASFKEQIPAIYKDGRHRRPYYHSPQK